MHRQYQMFDNGTATLANVRNLPDGWQNDSRYVYIGRGYRGLLKSKWANPFKMPDPENPRHRDGVIRMFHNYILYKPDLLNTIGELQGKVLVCHCYPEQCHGDVLIDLLNTRG